MLCLSKFIHGLGRGAWGQSLESPHIPFILRDSRHVLPFEPLLEVFMAPTTSRPATCRGLAKSPHIPFILRDSRHVLPFEPLLEVFMAPTTCRGLAKQHELCFRSQARGRESRTVRYRMQER